jgi:hypothetical protein
MTDQPSPDELGPLPEPAGFRTRYRSEPGMIGHYPWTYADAGRKKGGRPECEYEDLFTADQLRAAVAAERERCARRPLTRKQINKASRDAQISFCLKSGGTYEEELARAIEKAHGIEETAQANRHNLSISPEGGSHD